MAKYRKAHVNAEDGTPVTVNVPIRTKTKFDPDAVLKPAFDLVKNPRDWKAAISSRIPQDKLDAEAKRLGLQNGEELLAAIKEAIEFYTSTEASIAPVGNTDSGRPHGDTGLPQGWRITAAGYRMGPAGP